MSPLGSQDLVLTYTALLLRSGFDKSHSMPLINTNHNRTLSAADAEVGEEDEDSDDIPLAPVRPTHTPSNVDHGA